MRKILILFAAVTLTACAPELKPAQSSEVKDLNAPCAADVQQKFDDAVFYEPDSTRATYARIVREFDTEFGCRVKLENIYN